MKLRINNLDYTCHEITDETTVNGIACKRIYFKHLPYDVVAGLFKDNVTWGYYDIEDVPYTDPETGEITWTTVNKFHEYDLYTIPGQIIDYRNGIVSVDMIKITINDVLNLFKGVV